MVQRRSRQLVSFVLLTALSAGCGGENSDGSTAVADVPPAPPAAVSAEENNLKQTVAVDAAATQTAAADPVATRATADTSAQPTPATPEQLQAASARFLKQGNAQLALQALNQAIQLAPESAAGYLRRAELYTSADLKTQAIDDLSKAIELEPRNARSFNTRGYLRMAQNDLEGAVEDYAAAISIDLEYPQPYNNRGLVRISQGAPEKAVADFDAALRIDPKYIDAHNNRGYALTLLKRYDDAVTALSAAIEIDPMYVNAWNNRGLARKAAGQFAEAVEDFTKAIELQPSNTKHYLHRSEAFAALDRPEESRADQQKAAWLDRLSALNRTVASNPDSVTGWLERAEHMRQGQRFDAALTDCQRAIQLLGTTAPEVSEAYVLQARILLDQGRLEQAIEAANLAARVQPSDQVYSVRGDAYMQLKNYEAAVEDYRQSRRLDSTVQQAYQLLAAELESAGKVERAGYFREQAEALTPDRLQKTTKSESAEPLPFPVDANAAKPATDEPALK
ncbi:MAG: tetratricopeptide repeat protein [Planctomycetaceae bacterium]